MKNRIKGRNRGLIAEAGKIKIGAKHPTKSYPMGIDYFRPFGKFEGAFHEVYGEKPDKILIFFPNKEAITQRYVLYSGSMLVGESDGETVRVIEDKKDVYYTFDTPEEEEDFRMQYLKGVNKNTRSKYPAAWKTSLSMTMILADMRNVGGTWKFSTKGESSMVDQIANSFDDAIEKYGTIVGVPFWITVSKVSINSPREGNVVFSCLKLIEAMGLGDFLALKGHNDKPSAMITTIIRDLSPIKQRELQPKPQPQKEIDYESLHSGIESGNGTAAQAVKYYTELGGYTDSDLSKIKIPRNSYIDAMCNSIESKEHTEEVILMLERMGYEPTDEQIEKINEVIKV